MADLLSVLEAGLVGYAIPKGVREGVVKAFNRVLGDIWLLPKAYIHAAVQAIDDGTQARSLVTDTIAKSVAKQVEGDATLTDAAVKLYVPSSVRKVVNVAKVLSLTIEKIKEDVYLGEADAPSYTHDEEEDWSNSWYAYAENASSERMRDMWARILKGELIKPGSFSKVTLRTLYELEQDVALAFLNLQIEIIGDGINTGTLWDIMPGYAYAARQLFDAGLISFLPGYYFLNHEFDENGILFWPGEKLALQLKGPPGTNFRTGALPLTMAGRELRQLIDQPDEHQRFHLLHSKFMQLFSHVGVHYLALGEMVKAIDGSISIVNSSHIGPSIHPKPQPTS